MRRQGCLARDEAGLRGDVVPSRAGDREANLDLASLLLDPVDHIPRGPRGGLVDVEETVYGARAEGD